jgi:hypothetical protein
VQRKQPVPARLHRTPEVMTANKACDHSGNSVRQGLESADC